MLQNLEMMGSRTNLRLKKLTDVTDRQFIGLDQIHDAKTKRIAENFQPIRTK